MKKNGFTLVELVATIIVIGIVFFISSAVLDGVILSSKEKAYEDVCKSIEEAAYNYSVYNNIGYDTSFKSLSLDVLQETGYLSSSKVLDPRSNTRMQGCVLYRWVESNKHYEFIYSETCNIENN